MKVEIVIVTFSRDMEFLKYCLRSIARFASGFSGVTVLVPSDEVPMFAFIEDAETKLFGFEDWPDKGMLCHEYQIISADRWCPDADAILFVDADMIFWEPVTPGDYLSDGKLILLRERYSTLTNKLRLNWQIAVVAATGITPEWETMLRLPIIHLHETLEKTRELIAAHTGLSVADYIRSCRNEFPQGFAEHPTTGAVAIEHFADRYAMQDYDVRTPDGGYDYAHGKDKAITGWSHGGIERYRDQWEQILA